MSLYARFVSRNLAQLQRELKAFDSKRKPVAETATKIELYRLMRLLQGDLRQGQVAGSPFTPLRVVSRGTRTSKKPLAALAVAVRYSVKKEGDSTVMSVGFDGPQSSKAWRKIAHAVQEGGDINPDMRVFGSTLRKHWIRIGGDYKKGRGKGVAKFFFLRKATTSLKLPSRQIVEPFWNAHKDEAERNIVSNFQRKLAGERI